VRIAAWNIDTVGDPNVLDPVEYEATLAILLRIDADIVALNQIAGDDDGFHLRALAMEAGYDYVVVPESNPLGPQRNAMISRFAFAEEPVFHTAESLSGHEMANDITRWVVEGSFDLPKARSLYVFVQHWKASGGNDDEFRRSLESIRMRQAFADLDLERDAVSTGALPASLHRSHRTTAVLPARS
jgi:hypothetical protein